MSTIALYTGDGSSREFDITFAYRKASTIRVSVDGSSVPFSFVSASRVRLDVAPAAGTAVRVYRRTDVSEPEKTFSNPQILQGTDLNEGLAQSRERAEELGSEVEDVDRAIRGELTRAVRVKPGSVAPELDLSTGSDGRVLALAGGKVRPVDITPSDDYGSVLADLGAETPGKGAGLIGYQDQFGADNLQNRINILSATARPAMAGIFSGDQDQRAALLAFINEAAASGKTIEWGPIDVSLDVVTQTNGRRGLLVPTGSRWVMHPETRIRALPNANGSYEIVNLWNAQDVVIDGCGAQIIGDRHAHAGTAGEWGMGISVRGSTNVRISDLTVKDCWGDGVYIGVTPEQNWCQDTYLDRIVAAGNRRQGLSLISARGFYASNCDFNNTSGVAPQWGVDVEPNYPSEYVENVWFTNCRSSANTAGNGFGVFLNAMNGSTNPVSLYFVGCEDNGSSAGFHCGTVRDIPGFIEFRDCVSRNALFSGFNFRNKGVSGPRIRLVRPSVIDWNRGASSSEINSAGILLYATSADSGSNAIGGLEITNPDLRLNSGSALRSVVISDQRSTAPARQDIQILDPVNLAGLPINLGNTSSGFSFKDNLNVSRRDLAAASMTIGLNGFAVHNAAPASASTRTYDISNTQPIGTEMVLEVEGGPGSSNFRFPEGVSLYPDPLGTNRAVTSNTRGSRMKIRKVSDNEWLIIEKIGAWAAA